MTSPLPTVLMLLGLVSVAYLLTHLVVERAQQRFLFVSGAEYVLLGLVLGPHVLTTLQPLADLEGLAPVLAFAAGWVGLLYGFEIQAFRRERAPEEPATAGLFARAVLVALLDGLITGSAVTAGTAAYLVLTRWAGAADPQTLWSVALFLGASAAAGSSSAVEVLRSRYQTLPTQLLPMLHRANRFSSVLAIGVFGSMFALFHRGAPLHSNAFGWEAWALVTVGLGGVLGMLFYSFLGDDRDENHVFLAMVGIILFASGAAFFLNLSALAVNLVLGGIVALTHQGAPLRAELQRTARPVHLILLVFAGAGLRPVPLLALIGLTAALIALRLAAKWLAAALATLGTPLRPSMYRGLMAQGDVAVAMAVSFRLVYEGVAVDLAYAAVILSVVLHELVSPRWLRSLLVDAGELHEDLGPVGARR